MQYDPGYGRFRAMKMGRIVHDLRKAHAARREGRLNLVPHYLHLARVSYLALKLDDKAQASA